MRIKTLIIAMTLTACAGETVAHGHGPDGHTHTSEARYIANEAVLISHGETKVMFDPLPISGFGTYPETSAEDVAAMMAGEGAYAGIDVVLISHAHSDHFSAAKMLAYMRAQPDVKYVMPRQAVDMLEAEDGWEPSLLSRITVVDLGYGDGVQSFTEGDVTVETVRIPHAGWPAPKRAAVQNMVYRVTLGTEGGATIIHMGDADPRRQHFTPYKDHWDERRTDTAFPPYWFQICLLYTSPSPRD